MAIRGCMRLFTRLLVVVEECCGHQRLHETGHKTCGGGGMLWPSEAA